LVDQFPESLEQRIEDAIQRPWAQVIQFALELHPTPEPIISAMLVRPDDAFCTGLRLVGRCIANGAAVSVDINSEVGDQLVEFGVHAPSRARERVGRLLADGFSDPPTQALRDVLHHRWLIEYGAGDIISKLNEPVLTLEVLANLLENDRSVFFIWHSLKPALCAAGDAAVRVIVDAMEPDTHETEELVNISSAFSNFTSTSVSRELALSVACDSRLPMQVRLRAYTLAGLPLDDQAVEMTVAGFRHRDWDSHYEVANLVELHARPTEFLAELIRDEEIPLKRRRDLAAKISIIIPDAVRRERFFRENITDPTIDKDVSITLRLFAARIGDRQVFEGLVEEIEDLPTEHAATTIALFGHFPERDLAERAVDLIRSRSMLPDDVVRIVSSVSTGMRYIFEMDFGFGGALQSAPPHPGIGAWRDLLDEWAERADLSPRAQL
tara:strand:+ start:262 stop:1578 length:1317 start_codon:yes stop_codon:yes gene_type:complete